mgnify:FL=1
MDKEDLGELLGRVLTGNSLKKVKKIQPTQMLSHQESYRNGFDNGLERAIYELEKLINEIITKKDRSEDIVWILEPIIEKLSERIYHSDYGVDYKSMKEIKELEKNEKNM